jgi:hypothetical protein
MWRKSEKINVDGVDSDSEIDEAVTDTPPDIADCLVLGLNNYVLPL